MALNNKNNAPDKIIVTGNVNTHAKKIFVMVLRCKFLNLFCHHTSHDTRT